MDPNAPLRLWGKTNRPLNTTYHPLLFHLFDVACSAAVLWELLPDSLTTRMAEALHIESKQAGRFFALLSGLHDLGKGNPPFQSKADYLRAGLLAAGFDFPADTCEYPHNFVSVPEVERLLTRTQLFPRPLAAEITSIFTYALGAHHGVFPHADDLTPIRGRTLGLNAEWQQARNWLAEELRAGLPDAQNALPPQHLTAVTDRAFVPLLAAFISLADWFGSSRYFVMQGEVELHQYRKMNYPGIAEQSARTAVQEAGWMVAPSPPVPAGFPQMFAYLDTAQTIAPNALQQQVMTLLEDVQSPSLWIVEEEMGAGKTEAAFTIFDYAHIHHLAHGLYIAMPTQATSNAMHDRLGKFLAHRHPGEAINLILAHSHATLDPEYRQRMERADMFTAPVYDSALPEEGTLLVREWFTHNKQTLLAHYGVGTIDQALLGVLQTRHWFVRLFGLARKVVVFDEVHAYDAYMNTLLSRLITWLAEMDCTVVLLSATLPASTRLSLASAYSKGAKDELLKPENQATYPRITLVAKDAPSSARAVTVSKEANRDEAPPEPKRIALSHRANTPESVKAALLDAIPGDGCAIVFCNTVANAQQMFEGLKKDLGEGWECLLFHARTPFKWRKKREEEVLARFGKDSGAKRAVPRHKTVLVATQVAEQSLDLDADFMASEFAPVDLLLQRMGRLWRHKGRARTATEPHFVLLYDEGENGLPDLGRSVYVYAPHTLLRSWLVLKEKAEVGLPLDIEPLVASVYDAPDPTDLPEAWQQALSEAKNTLQQERGKQRKHANAVSVRLQEADATFDDWISELKPTLRDEEDPEIHQALRTMTRDGDPSLTVVLCGMDANGQSLAPDPTGEITPLLAQQMMGYSLPLSQKTIYHALKSERPPANWQKNAHLRHCRRIVFSNGTASVANRRLTLTKEKGLEIEKDETE